jgi:predicted amidophosphoribosyltransferase
MKIQSLLNLFKTSKYSIVDYQQDANIEVANTTFLNKKIANYLLYYIFSYQNEIVKDLFYDIKSNYNYAVIPFVYNILVTKLLINIVNKNDSVILFVPTDPKRFVERGFGLNEEIAKLLIRDGYTVLDIFIKIKNTPNQSLYNRNDRLNSENAFKIVDKFNLELLTKFKNIYIFDDVVTTGKTMMDLAYHLPYKNVDLLAIAS